MNARPVHMIHELLVVIVLYRSRLEDSTAFKSLLNAAPDGHKINFFVYDNSPEKHVPVVTDPRIGSIMTVHDPLNSGVSRAYNRGCEYACNEGFRWIMLSDHDTQYPSGFFNLLHAERMDNQSIHLFAPVLSSQGRIISPCRYILHRGSALKHVTPGISSLQGISLLNSGLTISVESFQKTGGFNENIRLDFSDFYFINRFKKLYPQICIMDIWAEHDISSDEQNGSKVLQRFMFYCQGARAYCHGNTSVIPITFWVLLRTLKCALRFRRWSFIRCFMSHFIFSKSRV